MSDYKKEIMEAFRKKFELHDVGKSQFTICTNSGDNTCNGGVSVDEIELESAEKLLENIESFLSQALTRVEEAEREIIQRMRDEHILKDGYARIGIPMSRKMHQNYHELSCGECQAYRKILSPSEEKEVVNNDSEVGNKVVKSGEKEYKDTPCHHCPYFNNECEDSHHSPKKEKRGR